MSVRHDIINYLVAVHASTGMSKTGFNPNLLRLLGISAEEFAYSAADISGKYLRYFPYIEKAAESGAVKLDNAATTLVHELRHARGIVTESLQKEHEWIVSKLHVAQVRPLFFKGREFNRVVTGVPRVSGDFDYLVRQADLDTAIRVLEESGYRQGRTMSSAFRDLFSPDDPGMLRLQPLPTANKLEVRNCHHQVHAFYKVIECTQQIDFHLDRPAPDFFVYFNHNQKTYALSVIDLHFNIATGMDEDDYLRGLKHHSIYSDADEFLAPEVLAFFFAGRAYYEPLVLNQPSYRDLIDLFAVLHNCKDGFDWDWLTYLSLQYGNQAALYYCLHHASVLMPSLVPDQVLEFLTQHLEQKPELDLGPFLPKAFGVTSFDHTVGHIIQAFSSQTNARIAA
ncbi:nucleotidyltransferase family protein [Allorhizobium undicola]|uniref:nucleotidyltransferase family protein n=1 Tax=Allorhizobium undicola TaxID=78527 RepID=UPI0004839BBA|nr:nucleotidyltransferase family protein [Allorhizobium undicola]